jgi:hypothetical protein
MVRQGALALLILAFALPSLGFGQESEASDDGFFQAILDIDPVYFDGTYLQRGNHWSVWGMDEYDSPRYFDEAFDHDVVLRVVVYPSFQPAYAVGIRNEQTGPVVFRLGQTEFPWSYPPMDLIESGAFDERAEDGRGSTRDSRREAINQAFPADPQRVATSPCERPIDVGLADRIAAIWKTMILDAIPPAEFTRGEDGADFDFSMPLAGDPLVEAYVWSPPEHSPAAHLIAISDWMAYYCQSDIPDEALADLDATVAAVADDLGLGVDAPAP